MFIRKLIPFCLPVCLLIALSTILQGCGSAVTSDYSSEVSAIYRQAGEEIEHAFEGLNHGEEGMVEALEEAAGASHEALEELEKVKVPVGLEDFHRESIAFLKSVSLSYEQQLTLLEPEEHHQDENHGESDDGE